MLQGLTGWHLVIILFIILLLFGAPKLPGLAKSLGQSMKILKKEVRNDDEGSADRAETPAEAAPTAPVSAEEEVAKARAEAEAAKRELERLKAQQAARQSEGDSPA